MIVLEVHWDNHAWMRIRKAVDPTATMYGSDHLKRVGAVMGQMSKWVRTNCAIEVDGGVLEEMKPYQMIVALDNIAAMLEAPASTKLTDEIVREIRSRTPQGRTSAWSELSINEKGQRHFMDPAIIASETRKCHDMLRSAEGRRTPFVMTMFGRRSVQSGEAGLVGEGRLGRVWEPRDERALAREGEMVVQKKEGKARKTPTAKKRELREANNMQLRR
jgi:hypothetical protein